MTTRVDGRIILASNDYQELAARTDPDRTQQVVDKILYTAPNGSWLLHSQIGLTGEVGELAAAIQRWLYYGKELDRTNVIEELGDLCWYLAQACRAMDVQLEDVMKANLAKLKFRYPERYTDFHAAEENRDREGERATLEQPSLMTAKDFIAVQTGPTKPNMGQCLSCKTPYSDRAPNFCPECGKAQTILK